MEDNTKRICLWSGPRNISTALMYSFAQRKDTKVFDEPLYAFYLSNSTAKEYHPGAQEIIQSMEVDGDQVIQMMLGPHDADVVFFKQMTHHLLDLDKNFLSEIYNIILTRDPVDMLPSYAKQVAQPKMKDVGYALHLELIKHFQDHDIPFVVLDSKSILMAPEEKLRSLCGKINIPFDHSMLAWKKGPIAEDGIWAKYWYANIHKSEGFQKYQAKVQEFPKELMPLLNEAKPIYQEIIKMAI